MGANRFLKSLVGRRPVAGSSGFALIEVLVVIGIISVAVGLVGNSVFQVFSVQQLWRAGVVATKDLRHAGSWFAGDALNAESVTVGGNPAGSMVTLTWTGSDSTEHTAIYSLSGNTLVRNFDGMENAMAERVVSHSFSFSAVDKVVTFDLEVEADRGGTESVSLNTYLRNLQ